MRHPVREYREGRQSAFPAPRLVMMVLGLIVLAMFIYRVRDPGLWQWLAKPKDEGNQEFRSARFSGSPEQPPEGGTTKQQPPEGGTTKQQPPEGGTTKQQPPDPAATPVSTGPTDEDPDEREAIRESRGAIEDGSLHMRRDEMVAYIRVLAWVENQPLEVLQQRARKPATYDQYVSETEALRFQLFEMNLDIRQVIPCEIKGPPPKNAQLYEVHGFTREAWYYGVVEDLPKDFPIGPDVRVQAKLVGYFFKLQGYHPISALSKAKAAPLKGPMFIGRLVWEPSAVSTADSTDAGLWVTLAVITIVGVAGAVFLAAVVGRRRRIAVPLTTTLAEPAARMDQWLDQARSGDVILGNNFQANGESSNGRAEYEDELGGHEDVLDEPGDGDFRRFPGGFDKMER